MDDAIINILIIYLIGMFVFQIINGLMDENDEPFFCITWPLVLLLGIAHIPWLIGNYFKKRFKDDKEDLGNKVKITRFDDRQ